MRIGRQLDPEAWDARLAAIPCAGPYHSARWGQLVTGTFGGVFRGLVMGDHDELLIPVLTGGSLAASGFVCGHIGYGAVLVREGGDDLPLVDQLTALRSIEAWLGLPCLRYVTTPRAGEPKNGENLTMILALPDDIRALWDGYSSKTRNAIRKAELSGLSVADVCARHSTAALALIHATQARVGSAYLTPPSLFADLLAAPEFSTVKGSFMGDALVSVGVFLRFGLNVTYFLNGWDDYYRSISPNYLMLHTTFAELVANGARQVDMGYSHSAELLASKRRWGAVPASFRRISDFAAAPDPPGVTPS